MKKAVRMLATGALSVLSLGMGMFSGCEWKRWQKEDSVYYGEKIAHTDWIKYISTKLPDGEGLFRSVEELQQFWGEKGYRTFEGGEEDPTDGNEREHFELYQKMKSYDEEFFAKKALILDFFEESVIYGELYVKAVALETEEELNVVTLYHSNGFASCAVVYWVCFIEVDRNDVEKVTILDVNNGFETRR